MLPLLPRLFLWCPLPSFTCTSGLLGGWVWQLSSSAARHSWWCLANICRRFCVGRCSGKRVTCGRWSWSTSRILVHTGGCSKRLWFSLAYCLAKVELSLSAYFISRFNSTVWVLALDTGAVEVSIWIHKPLTRMVEQVIILGFPFVFDMGCGHLHCSHVR